MLVLALTIPLMVFGLLVAVGPLVAVLVREHRAGTAGPRPADSRR